MFLIPATKLSDASQRRLLKFNILMMRCLLEATNDRKRICVNCLPLSIITAAIKFQVYQDCLID